MIFSKESARLIDFFNYWAGVIKCPCVIFGTKYMFEVVHDFFLSMIRAKGVEVDFSKDNID